jgi:exodeoxyribonuclease VII large subunit
VLGEAGLLMAARCASRVAAGSALADRLGAALEALSPLKVLERGFAVARDGTGRVLRRVVQFEPGMPFRLRVADGEVRSRVEADA